MTDTPLAAILICITLLMDQQEPLGGSSAVPPASMSCKEHSDDGQEQGRGSEHLFRLFVGWVPKQFTEQDLYPVFQQHGDVRDIIILKDKVSGQPRGCAFVSYATKEEATKAIIQLDRKVHLPGALCPLEVRFARSHQYVQAGEGPDNNRQLFFARASPLATEADLQRLFTQFGEVEDINLFRERRTNLSKACGFVTMAVREAALKAMEALDEQHVMEGGVTALAVKWADPELQIKKRRALEESNAEDRTLFFAKVLRSASEEDVRALFGRYGSVHDINLFRAFQGAPTSKGCGLITMGTHEEAGAAIAALDCRYTWNSMDAPMVVKWMDAALQKKRREEHLLAMRQGLVPSMGMTPEMWLSLRAATSSAGVLGPGGTSAAARSKPEPLLEAAPAGCAPDAYKLFVGNIPKHCTEAMLRPMFESVGQVLELVVVRDKATHESKGSAFVWYHNRAQADAAVVQFNMRQLLLDSPQPWEQERPLVVRRANTRKPAMTMGAAAPAGAGGRGPAFVHSMAGGSSMGGPPRLAVVDTATAATAAAGMMEGMVLEPHMQPVAVPVSRQMMAGPVYTGLGQGPYALIDTTQIPGAGPGGELHLSGLYNATFSPPNSSQQVLHMAPGQGMVMRQSSGLQPLNSMDTSGYVLSSASLAGVTVSGATNATSDSNSSNAIQAVTVAQQQQQHQVGMGQPQQQEGRTTLTLSLSAAEMQLVTLHIYSIQTMSGAEMSSQAMGPGLFYLSLTGTPSQVAAAHNLVGAVLTQGAAGMA